MYWLYFLGWKLNRTFNHAYIIKKKKQLWTVSPCFYKTGKDHFIFCYRTSFVIYWCIYIYSTIRKRWKKCAEKLCMYVCLFVCLYMCMCVYIFVCIRKYENIIKWTRERHIIELCYFAINKRKHLIFMYNQDTMKIKTREEIARRRQLLNKRNYYSVHNACT